MPDEFSREQKSPAAVAKLTLRFFEHGPSANEDQPMTELVYDGLPQAEIDELLALDAMPPIHDPEDIDFVFGEFELFRDDLPVITC